MSLKLLLYALERASLERALQLIDDMHDAVQCVEELLLDEQPTSKEG